MKTGNTLKGVLQPILSGTYTPFDVRALVQECYFLSLPLIRKRIVLGKLNLDIMRLKESDVVYDCLAELFTRNQTGEFTILKSYFEEQIDSIENTSDKDLLIMLRRLIFNAIQKGIIRLYYEVDPALGKILRNIKLALEKNKFFEQTQRFSETYLIPFDTEPLFHNPPFPFEKIRDEFANVVLIHDNVPEMLRKLYKILISQDKYQRAIPYVSVGMLFKEVYHCSWEIKEEETVISEENLNKQDVSCILDRVCEDLYNNIYKTYVTTGKRSEEVFNCYMKALRKILEGFTKYNTGDNLSYFDYLKMQIPNLTKEIYTKKHRTAIEYIVKIAKEKLAVELKNNNL